MSDYLQGKNDKVIDAQEYWERMVVDYRQLLFEYTLYYKFEDGSEMAQTVVPKWEEGPGTREKGKLVSTRTPKKEGDKHFVRLNRQNITILADAYFNERTSTHKDDNMPASIKSGIIDSTATDAQVIKAGERSKDTALVGLAKGLCFLRQVMCGLKYLEEGEANEEAGIEDDYDYESTELEYVANMGKKSKALLQSSIAAMNVEKFIFEYRMVYRIFVRGELGEDLINDSVLHMLGMHTNTEHEHDNS